MKGLLYRLLKGFILLSFLVYLFVLLMITLRLNFIGLGFQTDFRTYLGRNVNLIPFSTVREYLNAVKNHTMNLNIARNNLIGNVLLLFPLSIYYPYFFSRLRSFRMDIVFVLISDLSIEIIQLLIRTGSFDVDDVILNMAGAVIGFFVWKFIVYPVCVFLHLIEVKE